MLNYFLEETFSVPIKSNHSKFFFHLLISSIAVISKVILINKKVLQHITRYMYAPSFFNWCILLNIWYKYVIEMPRTVSNIRYIYIILYGIDISDDRQKCVTFTFYIQLNMPYLFSFSMFHFGRKKILRIKSVVPTILIKHDLTQNKLLYMTKKI